MFPSWVLLRGRKGNDFGLVVALGCGGWYLDGMSGKSDISDLSDIPAPEEAQTPLDGGGRGVVVDDAAEDTVFLVPTVPPVAAL